MKHKPKPPTPTVEPPEKRRQFLCGRCGGINVLADCYARWNVTTQKWEISTLFDKGNQCEDCGGECFLIEVILE